MKKAIVWTAAAAVVGFAALVARAVREDLRGHQLPGD